MTEDSRAANQIRSEPMPPSPAHSDTPTAPTGQPDTAAQLSANAKGAMGDAGQAAGPDTSQAGVPERAVTDVTPAPGTSETARPVEGVYVPDAGPGGDDMDTGERPQPGRPTGSS